MKLLNNRKKVTPRSYQTSFLLYAFACFILIFISLGFVAVYSIDRAFFKPAEKDILEYMSYFESTDSTQDRGMSPQIYDPRMIVVFYSYDKKAYVVGQPQNSTVDIDKSRMDISKVGKFQNELVSSYSGTENTSSMGIHYRTYLKAVEGDKYINNPNNPSERIRITYIKIYMNIDGEINSRNEIVKIYTLCVAVIIFLCFFASFYLSSKAIKPIAVSLNKQMDFVSDASHELRTPLAIVQSKIENTLSEPNKTVYDISEDLAIALNEISRLTKLTSDLLTLARSDNNNLKFDPSSIDLSETVKKIVDPFIDVAEIKGRKFTYNGIDNIKANVDVNIIKQVLIILLDNALRYTNEGDSIIASMKTQGNDIIFEVADTGIGISNIAKKHIFERFYREDKARSHETGGNGLGLSIAKTLVITHKGKISVNDNTPKGTKFTIVLPRVKE